MANELCVHDGHIEPAGSSNFTDTLFPLTSPTERFA